MSTPEGALPPRQVRALEAQRPGREWFWRIFAGLMLVSVGWVLWIAYQLQPRPLATEAAFLAAEQARRAPAPPQAAAPVAAATSGPATTPSPAQPPAAPPPQLETFRLAAEITTPVPEKPNRPAPSAAPAASRESQGATPAAALARARPEEPRATRPPVKLDLEVPPARILSAPAAPARVEKRDRARSAAERAESDFRRAVGLLNQGRVSEAEETFGSALAAEVAHEPARQALVALHLERGQVDDARRLLQEGLAINPAQAQFATVLGRILIERRDPAAALEVLARPAGNAEIHALRGNALQRLSRHQEAAGAYEAALRAAPQSGPSWLGLAISLEALARRAEAAEAYRRAAATGSLAEDVRDYAEQRARALR
jgi:MSHA biogenesis protein MshN